MMSLSRYWFGLAHGFNVRDGGGATTDQLRAPLEALGASVEEFDRSHENILRAALGLDSAARALAHGARSRAVPGRTERTGRTRVLVGHSHGCNVIRRAFELDPDLAGTTCSHVVLINPALRVDAKFPEGVQVACYYSPHDYVVAASLALRLLPWRWFWKHPWGEAGRKGMRNGAVNFNQEQLLGVRVEHSTVFTRRAYTERLVGSVTGWLARMAVQGAKL